MQSLLNRFFEKGSAFFGVEYPIICGAMSWITDSNLVSAVSNAGGLGMLAAGRLSKDELKNQIVETKEKTSKPFGINLVLLSNNIDDQIHVIKEEYVPFVVLAAAVPSKEQISRIKSYGSKILCFAPSLTVAKMLIDNGADALIIEGSEAGGHIGSLSTSILVQEILLELKDTVPIIVAGGIITGEVMSCYLLLGACGVQLGTVFACSREANVNSDFKSKYLKARATDTVIASSLIPNIKFSPVRCLKNNAYKDFYNLQYELVKEFENGCIDEYQVLEKIECFWMGRLFNGVKKGDIKNGSLMAGETVGLVKKSLSAKEIIRKLVFDGERFLEKTRKAF